jgi:hypothetical protein
VQPFSLVVNSLALVCVFVALVIPNRIDNLDAGFLLALPLEMAALALLLLPGRIGLWLRWLMAALLSLGVILKGADAATFHVFARPFNPLFDFYLVINGMNLLSGVLGSLGALLFFVVLLLLVAVIFFIAYWVLGSVQRVLRTSVSVSLVAIFFCVFCWLFLYLNNNKTASLQFYHHLAVHAQSIVLTIRDQQLFQQQLDKEDRVAYKDDDLLTGLSGKDVLVVFVESYGRTVIDNPEFSAHMLPLLEQSNQKLAEKKFIARSGYLTSPTVGGLSWLAHGTAMSGLWIDNQIRYNNLVLSQRPTLNRLFNRAGWRTLAVMPAITMAWPEGNYYGYDKIYHANNLGYQGLPFNWVTMPDQYTLAAFQKFERTQKMRSPVMAEIALISSHAPWTPVPQMIDWAAVGDGRIFNAQAASGDSPEVVWKDNARIRQQYRLAIAYAVENIISYITTYGDDNLVLLILGDHQPAPIVTGDLTDSNGDEQKGSRDVPVHLITRDESVINAIEHWQWTPGMVPSTTVPVWPMDTLRNRFIDAFSSPAD